MQKLVSLFALFQLCLLASPVQAQEGDRYGSVRTVTTESWVEEYDPATGSWVKVAEGDASATYTQQEMPTVTTTYVNGEMVSETRAAARYAKPAPRQTPQAALGYYGPFLVTSATSAQMIGPTDSASPHHFDAMLRDYPQLAVLEMVEAPGTSNDIANLAVGRRIRAAGIATHVPQGGSVRSGAVELFLAGATRSVDDGAQFAVHSWLDNHGREADDFASDHSAHRLYLDYYVEMGMSEQRARDFYAMTNSVPHSSALWLVADDMRRWIAPEHAEWQQGAKRFVEQAQADNHALALIVADVVAEAARHAASRDWEAGMQTASRPALLYGDMSDVTVAHLDLSRLDS